MSQNISKLETELISILQTLLKETRRTTMTVTVTIDSDLDKDIGLDSLTKIEYLRRVEKHLGTELDTSELVKAKSIRKIIHVILHKIPQKQLQYDIIEPLAATTVDVTEANTLIEVLKRYATTEPDRPHIYLQDAQGVEKIITYSQLYKRASLVAANLQALGLKPQETVAIMLPTEEGFFYCFMGILLAGGIPVPIYPPVRPDQIEEYALREARILDNAEIRFLITFAHAKRLSKLLSVFVPSLTHVITVPDLLKPTSNRKPVEMESQHPAMIQYTSGSTGDPKGVLLTHSNLLANIRSYGRTSKLNSQDVLVSWLPLYHDMGLIGSWLGSFYHALPAVIMSPLTFLSNPARWLWTMHYHRATVSPAPNFAYELCINKISEQDLEGLDLSTWRLAFNGAEAISANTLERFSQRFASYGLSKTALVPSYGLAENSVALTISEIDKPYNVDTISANKFSEQQIAKPADPNEEKTFQFVNCGRPIVDHQIRIVNREGHPCRERQIGELEFCGPSMMQGYFQNKPATDRVRDEGWIKTGDQAYIAEGQLYITGRNKDIIIRAGRNLYPESIEYAATQVPGMRKGCAVAMGIEDASIGTENVIIIAETNITDSNEQEKLRNLVIERVATVVGEAPDQIVFVPPHTIPKTSSGKLRRNECKQLYLNKKLLRGRKPVSLQMARLIFRGANAKLKSFFTTTFKLVYTLYCILISITLFPFACATIFLLPKRFIRRTLKNWCRLFFFAIGCRLRAQGTKHLPKHGPLIYAANHMSYLDPLILIATLPTDIRFTGIKELFRVPVFRTLLKKIDFIPIDRSRSDDRKKLFSDMHHVLENKESIILFVEGMFRYTPGLRPFKMGAFSLAATSLVPICPVAIRGARHFMTADWSLLRPVEIEVTITELVTPHNGSWDEITRLQHITQQQILAHCGEQLLSW